MNVDKSNRDELIARWYAQGFYTNQSVADTLLQGAERHPEAFLVLESEQRAGRISLAEALVLAQRYAAVLSALDIKAGDVVAIQLPNWIEAVLLCQAVWLLGGIVLPVTAVLGASDLAYILTDANAKALFMPRQWKNRHYGDDIALLRQQTRLSLLVMVDDSAADTCMSWQAFTQYPVATSIVPPAVSNADDVALIIYTSGTTSRPKGVMHTHNSLICEASKGQPNWGQQRYGTHLSPWPHGHIASTITMVRWWIDGVSIVLADQWEPEFVARLVEKYHVAATSGVPYFLSSLLAAADRFGIVISSLKNYATGASNVPPELIDACRKRGIFAYRMYGSTEHPTATSGVPGDPSSQCSLSDGRPLPGNEVRIVDDQGQALAAGMEGEIVLRGPEQFLAYVSAENNATAFLAGGWFLTGDIGRVDSDGYVTITDRKKDIIIRGGENISSREVEEAVNSLASVRESAAVAMPDPRLGEKVCCFIVLYAGAQLTLEELSAHFTSLHIARFKTPERLIFIDELPRNATGKVQKQRLRARLSVS